MLILASSSPYRRALLEQLRIPFATEAPHLDETPHPSESPRATSLRLARQKAQKVALQHPEDLIIGCDQVAVLGDEIMDKPLTHERAVAQLQRASGQLMVFHTALCLLNARTGNLQQDCILVQVRYRTLDSRQIERYLQTDRPYDCAGSTKIEAFGITIVDSVDCHDPTALVGLPLITLTRLLAQEGILLP